MSFAEMLAEESAETIALAETLSLAVLIEPALLRRARLELHPGLEVGVEGDLWFSSLVVSSGPDGIVLHRDAAEGLRSRLQGPRLASAWALLQTMHAAASPALRLEEEIAWRFADQGDAARPKIRDLLRQAIASLVGGERTGLAHWAVQAVHRLPRAVRELEEVAMLEAAAQTRLGDAVEQDGVPEWMAWIQPGSSANKQPIRFTLFQDVLEIQAVDPAAAGDAADVITVPALRPLQLEIQDGDRRHTVVVEEGAPSPVRVGPGQLEIHVSDGSVYELSPATDLEAKWRREIVQFAGLFREYDLSRVPLDPLNQLQREAASGGKQVLVRGQPGTGKTALLTALARRPLGRPVAWHFFSSRTHEWRDHDTAWASVAAQIERAFPKLRQASPSQLDRLRDLLARIPRDPRGPLLLILDGVEDAGATPGETDAFDVRGLFPHGIPETVTLVCSGPVSVGPAASVIDLDEARFVDERKTARGVDWKVAESLRGNLLAMRLAEREPGRFAEPLPADADPAERVATATWSALPDAAQRLLGIIAASYEPLTWWRIREAAGTDTSREITADVIAPWIVTGKTPDFEDTAAVAHEHLRRIIVGLRGEHAHMDDHEGLLSTVAEWTPKDRGEFQKEYSLRYGLAHAVGSRNEHAVQQIAANLDVLEARARQDPPRLLVADLQRAIRSQITTPAVRAIADALSAGVGLVAQDPAAVRYLAHGALRANRLDVPIAGRPPSVRLRHLVAAPGPTGFGHRGSVRGCLPFMRGDALVSWSADGTLKVWSSADATLLDSIPGHTAAINRCAVWEDTVVSGGQDCAVRVWTRGEPTSRLLVLHDGPVLGVHLERDRITSWDDHGTIVLSSSASYSVLRRSQAHEQAVTACLVGPEWIASGSADHTIRVWSRDMATQLLEFVGHSGAITTLIRSSAHGPFVSGADDGTLREWDPSSGETQATLRGHDSAVLHCIPFAGGESVVSCSRDHSLRLWNLGEQREVFRLVGHEAAVLGCVVLPDRRLLSWSADRTLRLWSMEDGRPLGVLEGHAGPVNSALVINDGQVVSCSDDRELLRWQVGQWTHR